MQKIQNRRKPPLVSLFCSALVFSSLPAVADSPAGDWHYRITPYLWAAGLEGSVATLPPVPPTDIDLSFSDVLDNLDMSAMVLAEARKGRWGILGEALYMGVSADRRTRGPLFSAVGYDQNLWQYSVMGSYSLSANADANVELVAGISFWDIDNSVSFTSGALNGRKLGGKASWHDYVLGVRGRFALNEHFFFIGHSLAAAAGDSDTAWELYGAIGYRFGPRYSLVGGYRHKTVNYDEGPFLYDVDISGPLVGLNISF